MTCWIDHRKSYVTPCENLVFADHQWLNVKCIPGDVDTQ